MEEREIFTDHYFKSVISPMIKIFINRYLSFLENLQEVTFCPKFFYIC